MGISLEEISKYIEIKKQGLEDQNQENTGAAKKIQEARQLIRDFSIPEKKTFTFTVGELNAYLG